MAKFSQIPTPEDIEAVRTKLYADARAKGLTDDPPFWLQKFAGGEIQFIVTWMDAALYDRLNFEYMKAATKDPAAAERFLQIQTLQYCVLWPPTFNPSQREELQPYPAGVIPGLVNAIMAHSDIGVQPLPDVLLFPPAPPKEPTAEERAALEASAPFGIFEKLFVVGSYNTDTDNYDLIPSGYVLYTLPDHGTNKRAQATGDEEKGVDVIVNGCTLWPPDADYNTMPAGYKDAIYVSIMSQLGLAGNTDQQSEEL